MPDYGYYKKESRRVKPSRGNAFMRIADAVVLVVTVVCSLLLIMSFLSSYIDPNRFWPFAFAGILFPVIYAAQTVITLYWILRWKRRAIWMLALLLICIGRAGLFYRPDFRKHYDDNAPLKSELVVMSYNVMWFNDKYRTTEKNTMELIADFVSSQNVDILCIQEFNARSGRKELFDELMPDFKYNRYNSFDNKFTERNPESAGPAIYSRYPIIDDGFIANDSTEVYSIWADIKIKRDTVRIINNHLQSTYVNNSDVDFLSSYRSISDDEGKKKIADIVAKMTESYKKRAPQADNLARFIAASPYPVIVCGDFNDTPASYAYHRIRGDMQDAFVEQGRGANGTYNGFFNMFRIDYILFSRGLQVLNYYPFDVVYSDHNPVAASFDFK